MSQHSKTRAPVLAGVLGAALMSGAVLAAELPDGSPESVGMSSERLGRLDNVTHGWVDEGRIAGVVTLIARRGRVVHLDAYGMADIENREPMTEATLFRLFSMTKPVTSVALLTLYEEGKFQLRDPLADYLPAFADVKVAAGVDAGGRMILEEPERAPTMADVFRHTAGFSYGSGGPAPVEALYDEADLYGSGSLEELADKLAEIPLIYQPGTRWVYSFSHDVQARLVEVLSGMRFEDYVRARIFEPLGMDEVVFGLPRRLAGRFANTYSPGDDGYLAASDTPEDTSYDTAVFGGTSLAGPVTDYARFAQMLANSGELDGARILGTKTVDLMDSDHLPEGVYRSGGSEDRGEGYGLGVRVVTDAVKAGNLTSAGTFGWSGAAGTHFIVDREEDLIALFMIQRQGPGGGGMSADFETMVYQAIVD